MDLLIYCSSESTSVLRYPSQMQSQFIPRLWSKSSPLSSYKNPYPGILPLHNYPICWFFAAARKKCGDGGDLLAGISDATGCMGRENRYFRRILIKTNKQTNIRKKTTGKQMQNNFFFFGIADAIGCMGFKNQYLRGIESSCPVPLAFRILLILWRQNVLCHLWFTTPSLHLWLLC